jgi:hypothetical protein
MLLAGYSDSESDTEPQPQKPAPKPAFQKVVDRANPGRITLNLSATTQSRAPKDDIDAHAPPAKKQRMGGGFGGFNSMLPAPKKAVAKPPASDAAPGSRGLGRGLGAGVNLRTGAEPAFKREPKLDLDEFDENGNLIKKQPMNKDDFRAMLNLPAPKSEKKPEVKLASPAETPVADSQPPPKAAPRFVPMSVGKGKKKKPVVARPAIPTTSDKPATATTNQSNPTEAAQPPRKPKVSLFGVSQETTTPASEPSSGPYKPMMYGFDEDEDEEQDDAAAFSAPAPTQYAPAPAHNNLTNAAEELNLSEADRRMLFGKKGRGGPDFSSAKIVEFNTDTEYAHNEQLRQQGETVQHNPLKSITGTGKNSLRSLVSVASTQKDALEEHFATSHRNKKEAGNRYGW